MGELAAFAGPPAHRVRDPGVDGTEHAHGRPEEVVRVSGTTLHVGDLHHWHLRLRDYLEPEPHVAQPGLLRGELLARRLEVER